MEKSSWINIVIVLVILIFAFFTFFWPKSTAPEELAKCIGNNSVVYIQNGCSHCVNQEKLFGENFKFIHYVNCTEDWSVCSQIEGTPTWLIKNQFYKGEASLEELKNLTGC